MIFWRMASQILTALKRKKRMNDENASPLARVLTLLDLTALGVGATLGLGVYVLAGSVAKTVAGPAVCLSFLVAAIASAVAGLCYAEFAARVPKAGSAYVYSYVSVGEFAAFVIGWNLILEYVIGTASVARGMSNYIDALTDKQIRNTLTEWMPINIEFLSPYPDFLSFFFVIALTAVLAFGVKESSTMNNAFTVLNLITIIVAIVAGSMKADVNNWRINVDDIEERYKGAAGAGGFLPFGVAGVTAGAAKCFYGFVGFDAVATTGEEAKNPQRDIPLSIVISLTIIFAAYFAISTVLTMMWPYYLQDPDAPFPYVFEQIGWQSIKWVVTVGAIFALCTSLLGAMFPLPRVIYAMSKDGVVFKSLAKVNAYTQTPLIATALSGLLSGAPENMHLKLPTWSEAREALTRKKVVEESSLQTSKLAKVLTTFDLTALGVGSTLGVGVYVLAGDVAKNTAGPAVIVSFFVAALASILAGLCYAEFGARVPKAGSAYVYSYVCIGEFFAFIIGWNLILEYLIGSAASTKAIFLYIDQLANNTMTEFFEENIPLSGNQISTYADLFSLGLAILFSVALACGAKESSWINNVFTLINLIVVVLVIVSGCWKVDIGNWQKSKQEAMGKGDGGFFPYGIKGVVKGAARCFYGFIGFDCIATAGEEAKTPKKSIPIGVVGSLLIVFLAYFGMSTIMTMLLPYYEQDENAPLAYIYTRLDWTVIKYIVSVGAIAALFSSLLGAMFPLPRIIYAMANDGLIFKTLGKVNSHFHTPLMGTLFAGILSGILACILELSKLTEMMSIGTLLAYSMVAACVLVLRYARDDKDKKYDDRQTFTLEQYVKQVFNRTSPEPTPLSSAVVTWEILVYFVVCFIVSGLMTGFEDDLYEGTPWLLAVCSLLIVVLIIILTLVSFQPTVNTALSFSVPLIPWIPGISIFTNIYLMTNIQKDTWIKYTYWMIIGLLIYFIYGLWHSTERSANKTVEPNNSVDTENGSINQTSSSTEQMRY